MASRGYEIKVSKENLNTVKFVGFIALEFLVKTQVNVAAPRTKKQKTKNKKQTNKQIINKAKQYIYIYI